MKVQICEGCGKKHSGEYGSGRFCSASCARGYATRARREEINSRVSAKLRGRMPAEATQEHWFKPKELRSEEMKTKIATGVKASYFTRREAYLLLWKSGKAHPSEKRAKRLLIHEHGEKCQRCGWAEQNPYSNTIPIELEHKDGDYKNNRYENVELLCPNHHSLTSTFRGLNVGKGKGREMYKLVSQWAKERRENLLVRPEGIEPSPMG